MNRILFFLTILLLPSPAYAYIGPGLGAGTLSVILGVVVSVFLAIFAIIWYPIKRFLKKMSRAKSSNNEE
ncbi:MAG: hypothetical protein COY36_03485 [Zetaproteobacteria bacterium CG_4_10_14_0_2_um_filter_55_20]|nr:MAG: hypothetical protein COZ01_02525 [Zetaproteobacteria bacterium CG_4_10_14_0_8_um_filter_55_43]PIZ39261.1 MAG: hypothetical protein COY36_03485 [Zetaproteobacteria bacterium CG_4_10_14_0_2_um_filter_55_20]